ncbi:MAG: GatB/YqeY domain-containing protein, partial [Methylocapsa sp.]|nr:GatB/YqeY domain-containing protein [Methylocapsa sp.]
SSVRDMGKVIGMLKGEYAGQMDFTKASARVKAILSG